MKKDCYKKTLPIFLLALACICLPLLGFAGESTEQTYIQEHYATIGNVQMEFDMLEPPLPPATLPQMKMERIHFDKKFVQELIAKYGVKPSPGENWELHVKHSMMHDVELVYQEVNWRYGATHYEDSSPKRPVDKSNPILVQANDTVKAFLDELGITYEYPFHVVQYIEPVIDKGVPLIQVIPRLLVEGLPFHTSTGWTRYSDRSAEGTGDPTPICTFSVTEDGEIANIMIQNPVRLLKSKEDTRPILGWREILDKGKEQLMHVYENTDYPADAFILKEVEFLMMIDARQIAYPVWVYNFKIKFRESETEDYSYYSSFPYDARTGKAVWYYEE